MSAGDFARQVEADARAQGWPADVAAALARYAGKHPEARPARPSYATGKAPRPTAMATKHPAGSLSDFLSFCGLPATMLGRFEAAGLNADTAMPLLIDYMAAKRRGAGAAAATALHLTLLSKATFRGKH